jgi:uncharacterized SAM-binding protein YcdF (DUF218 family)
VTHPLRSVRSGPVQAPRSSAERRAIVILGALFRPDGQPTPNLERRLVRGLELAAKDPRAELIVTGGVPDEVGRAHRDPLPQGSRMKQWLVARGVDPARIHVDDEARFTVQNVANSARMIQERGFSSAVLVTDRLHMLRTFALFRHALGPHPQMPLGASWVKSSFEGPGFSERLREERAQIAPCVRELDEYLGSPGTAAQKAAERLEVHRRRLQARG